MRWPRSGGIRQKGSLARNFGDPRGRASATNGYDSVVGHSLHQRDGHHQDKSSHSVPLWLATARWHHQVQRVYHVAVAIQLALMRQIAIEIVTGVGNQLAVGGKYAIIETCDRSSEISCVVERPQPNAQVRGACIKSPAIFNIQTVPQIIVGDSFQSQPLALQRSFRPTISASRLNGNLPNQSSNIVIWYGLQVEFINHFSQRSRAIFHVNVQHCFPSAHCPLLQTISCKWSSHHRNKNRLQLWKCQADCCRLC
jgi:hypothetical protein